MKIISKFKDFYDYLVNYHDTDDQILYVREPKYIKDINSSEELKDINEIKYLVNTKNSNVLISDPFNDCIAIIKFNIIGIYPVVYTVPSLCIYSNFYNRNYYYSRGGININSLVLNEIILDPKIFNIEYLNNILRSKNLKPKMTKGKGKKKVPVIDLVIDDEKYVSLKDTFHKDKKPFKEEDLIVENPNIFKYLNSPCFYSSDLTVLKQHEDSWYYKQPNAKIGAIRYDIVIDPDFSEVKGISLDKFSQDLSVRERIERFLIEASIKPIPEPDNNTKILSAGFDLKTSFRKM